VRWVRKGKLGVQAEVRAWQALEGFTDNVNSMAGNLTAQVRNIAEVTKAVANGDPRRRSLSMLRDLDLKDTINVMVDQLSFASRSNTVARVGTEGKLGGQAVVWQVPGRIYRGGQLNGRQPHSPVRGIAKM